MGRAEVRRLALLAAGLTLATTLSGCFSSPPQIIALQPSRGSVGVPADAPITVQFDRSVSTDSVVGRFLVSPDIPGCDLTAAFSAGAGARCHVVWQSGDSAFTLIHTRAVMASDTIYNFTLLGGFRATDGVANTVDHHWQIRTQLPPEVRTVVPPAGSTGFPADSPLTVTFSTTMDPVTTAAAISLSPPVAGTRITPSRTNLSQFVVLPGQPLMPGDTYHLLVSGSATDDHGERLKSSVNSTFIAGGLSAGDHATVLLARAGEPASVVAVALPSAGAVGDPVAAQTVLTAPRCGVRRGCGAVADGGLLYGYVSAALSPDGRWLAVVEEDLSLPRAPRSITMLNPATGAVRTVIPGATLPSWAADSRHLAFATGDAVGVYSPASSSPPVTLPRGQPLLAPPEWGPHAELLVLSGGPPAAPRIELGDAQILLRYPVPGLAGFASSPALSPDGTQLAVVRHGAGLGGTWLVSLGTGPATPRRLDARLTPSGWVDTGTLLGTVHSSQSTYQVVTVNVSTGEETDLPIALTAPLSSIVVAPSGRMVAYLSSSVTVTVQNSDGSDAATLLLPGAPALRPVAVTLS